MRLLPLSVLLAGLVMEPAASTQPPLARARRLAESGRWGAAEKALAWKPGRPWGPSELELAVNISSKLNHWSLVVRIYEDYRSRHPLSVAQRISYYEACLKAGQRNSAERELRSLIRDHPSREEFVHLLAFLQLTQGRFQEAEAVYRRFLLAHPKSYQSRINLALILFKLEQGAAAFEQLKNAFVQEPEQANLYLYRQLVRNMPPQGLDRLVEDVKQELGLPSDGARTHLLLAREFDRLDRYDPAIEHYQMYLKAVPEDPAARNALARLYYHVGDDSRSEAALAPLLQRNGPESDQARMLAAELAIRSSRFQRAARLLEQLPAAYRNQPLYQYFQARILLNRGDTAQAERLLKQVTIAQPDLAQPYFHLAQIYFRSGRVAEGRKAMAQFQNRKQ